MEQHSQQFLDNATNALADAGGVAQRDIMALFAPLLRDAAVEGFGNFEALRQHVKRVRQHSLDNLDYYLARFELEATNNGNQVHYAETGEDLNSIVLDICQQHGARKIAKGKSMVTEETGLNDFLLRAGLEVIVLEAAPRIGGRVLTEHVDGVAIDLGGMWLGADHGPLM